MKKLKKKPVSAPVRRISPTHAAAKATLAALKIPAILLEGDEPFVPSSAGPEKCDELGLIPHPEPSGEAGVQGALPAAYGSGRLWLAAPDPHTLYVCWDFSRDQLQDLAREGQLQLHLHAGSVQAEPSIQVPLAVESQHQFVSGVNGGTKYLAELGYYTTQGAWVAISASNPTLTPLDLVPATAEPIPPTPASAEPVAGPPDTGTDDTIVRFATLPLDVPLPEIVAAVPLAFQGTLPLLDAIERLGSAQYASWPPTPSLSVASTPDLLNPTTGNVAESPAVQRPWVISFESPVFRQAQSSGAIALGTQAPSSWAPLPIAAGPAVSSPAGAGGGPEQKRPFWFAVNAELVIYGATTPDARVTLGDQPIQLRPDGTFSCRVALPDGSFELPATAVSADGMEMRRSNLSFSRSTHYDGS